jgi:hypothetical protein
MHALCFYNIKIFKLILCFGVHEFGLLARFVAFNFDFLSCLIFRCVHIITVFIVSFPVISH